MTAYELIDQICKAGWTVDLVIEPDGRARCHLLWQPQAALPEKRAEFDEVCVQQSSLLASLTTAARMVL